MEVRTRIAVLTLFMGLLLGCSKTEEVVYSKEEIQYLEGVNEAVTQMTKSYDEFTETLVDVEKNGLSEEASKDLFKGMLTMTAINVLIEDELESPSERFKEVDTKLAEASSLLSEATTSLPMLVEANHEQLIDENLKKVEDAAELLDEISLDILEPFEKAVSETK
ncbi:hypothetical protein ACVBAX_13315 [Robertmurraya sp. GLU-23]